jgi:Golgi SNAP receptor complex protein 2
MTIRLEELERLANREPKSHRDDYKRRVMHLKASHQHIKSSLESFMRRKNYNPSFESQKEDLFSKADLEGGWGSAIRDTEVAENSSLNQSQQMVKNYIAIGQQTLEELVGQRDRLKTVQRKVFDMLNYLGLSNSLMKSVERRDVTDKWIVIAGALIISCLLFCIWYFRSR